MLLDGKLVDDVVQHTLRLELLDDLVAVELVQLGVLGNSRLEAVKELLLLEVIANGALDGVHLGPANIAFLHLV